MACRGSRHRCVGPVGSWRSWALAASPDKGPRARGCPQGGRAGSLPPWPRASLLADSETRPPGVTAPVAPGCVGPTGLILPSDLIRIGTRSQGRPGPSLLLFWGPGERLVPTGLGFTVSQVRLLGRRMGGFWIGPRASDLGAGAPLQRLDSGQRNPKSSCCLQSIPAALGFRSLLSCLSSAQAQVG